MKIKVVMKDPDAISTGIEVARSDKFSDEIRDVCSKWFRGGERITIEIDTEKKTATVIPI